MTLTATTSSRRGIVRRPAPSMPVQRLKSLVDVRIIEAEREIMRARGASNFVGLIQRVVEELALPDGHRTGGVDEEVAIAVLVGDVEPYSHCRHSGSARRSRPGKAPSDTARFAEKTVAVLTEWDRRRCGPCSCRDSACR